MFTGSRPSASQTGTLSALWWWFWLSVDTSGIKPRKAVHTCEGLLLNWVIEVVRATSNPVLRWEDTFNPNLLRWEDPPSGHTIHWQSVQRTWKEEAFALCLLGLASKSVPSLALEPTLGFQRTEDQPRHPACGQLLGSWVVCSLDSHYWVSRTTTCKSF